MDATIGTKRKPGPPWLMLFLVLVLGLTMFSNLTAAREIPGMTLDLGPGGVTAGAPSSGAQTQPAKPSTKASAGPQAGSTGSTATALQGAPAIVVPKTGSIVQSRPLPTLKRLP